MDRPVNPKLREFLRPYDGNVVDLAFRCRALILEEVPLAYELLYDSYNAVSAAYSYSEHLRDAFCHVAIYTQHVNLGFNQGTDLEDPNGFLQGSGKKIRHLRIESTEDLEQPHVRDFIRKAAAQRNQGVSSSTEEMESRSIVKSVSENKRRPSSD